MNKTDDVQKALEVLNTGGIILYPTDTVWGIGCDATNPEAVTKVYQLKKREDSKSMIVLIDNANRIPSYIREMPDIAYDLIDFTTKPLTVIFDNAKNLAQNLIAQDGSVGIRVAQDDFCSQLIQKFNRPIVSTSANISGHPTPTTFLQIEEVIKNQVDYIVQHKQEDNTPQKASSIIKLSNDGAFKIIRE